MKKEHLLFFFVTLFHMRAALAAFSAIVLSAAPLLAAGLGTPQLSTPMAMPELREMRLGTGFFDADRLLTNAGVTYSAAESLTLEPEFGIGYQGREWELRGGMEQSTHRLHAQAGWRLSLADTLYLSAAAKLPMLTIESVGLQVGEEMGVRPASEPHQSYDFSNPSRDPLAWRGELGMHLSPQADLTLYYDQTPLSGWSTGSLHQEERIGTRFILRFK